MAHFGFENDVNAAMKLDKPPTRGPLMRWERKMVEGSTKPESSSRCSASNILKSPTTKPLQQQNAHAEPGHSKSESGNSKTPGTNSSKTPNKTPTRGGTAGDRFIPNRSTTQAELGHFLVSTGGSVGGNEPILSPSKEQFQKVMNDNLNGAVIESKIIGYQQRPPELPEGRSAGFKVLYSMTTPGSTVKSVRHIPQAPERILDAPEMMDDYYLNLLDWSSQNMLAVCLGSSVYLWNASTGDIQQLTEMENNEEYVSSLAWIKEGNHLAVGTSTSEVQLWDVTKQKKLRSMGGHAARVGSLSWNAHILSSGSRTGYIHHHDVRVADHLLASIPAHSQEVCGLKWSPDGKYLASGGNDNLLNLWSSDLGQTSAVHSFNQHQAAVKAVAWCPHQSSLLTSGGGTADRCIRFWNVNTGSCLKTVDTNSQVCALLWSKEYKEIISSHGFALNQLTIWGYPSMTKVAELTGHTNRVLHMAMSPDGSTVVSAAADETLRLWKCFSVDPQKKIQKSASKHDAGMLRQSIR